MLSAFFFSYLELYCVFFSLKLNLCQVFLCITTSLVNGIKCLNIYILNLINTYVNVHYQSKVSAT